MRPMKLAQAIVALSLTGCLSEYTILSGSETGAMECPPEQELCGEACVPVGTCEACPTEQANCDECPADQEKCGETCVALGTCECTDQCPTDLETCVDNICQCRDGLVLCGDLCVDTRTDPHHCGICDNGCDAAAPVCQDGHCIAHCEAPRLTCTGACVDATTDSLNCGTCGNVCKADEICMASECHAYSALPGCASCPCPQACDGTETCCNSPFLDTPVCIAVDCL